jgi:hypothetical protein
MVVMRLEILGKLKKKLIYLIGTWSRDLSVCSITPQPSTLLFIPLVQKVSCKVIWSLSLTSKPSNDRLPSGLKLWPTGRQSTDAPADVSTDQLTERPIHWLNDRAIHGRIINIPTETKLWRRLLWSSAEINSTVRIICRAVTWEFTSELMKLLFSRLRWHVCVTIQYKCVTSNLYL